MKTRIFTLLIALLAMATGLQAQQITSLTMTIRQNGEAFTTNIPATGFEDVDLTGETITSLVIQDVEIETSGNISEACIVGGMYNQNETPRDDDWRNIPLEDQGEGKFALKGMNAELIESGKTKVKVFEFYAYAKDGSGNTIYYNNGGSNYKIIFVRGGDAIGWKVKFYKDQTATLSLLINNTQQDYAFNGDAERTPGTDLQPGQLRSLVINGFSLDLVRNDDVSLKDVSIQYKVYEEGQDGNWNRLDAQSMTDDRVYNKDKDVYENHVTFRASGLNCEVAEGLVPGKDYVLEIIYQVVVEGDYIFLGKNKDTSCFRFSIVSDDNPGTPYDIDGDGQLTIGDITALIQHYLDQ